MEKTAKYFTESQILPIGKYMRMASTLFGHHQNKKPAKTQFFF